MTKKILQLVVVLIITAQGVMAQSVSIANDTYVPGEITVQVDMVISDDIGSISLDIEFDSDLMDFVGIDDTQLSGSWIANQTGNILAIRYMTSGAGSSINGKLLDMLFVYKGGFASDLIFDTDECEITDDNLGVITNITYTDGSVQQNTTDAMSVSMPTDLVETIGNTIDVPVTLVDGDTYDVEAITLKVAYNENELAFTGIVDGAITGAVANASNGVVTINWTGTESCGATSTLLYVQFVYNGGNADMEFIPGCEFATTTALPVTYTDGMVTATPGTASLTISTETVEPGSTVDVPIVALNFGDTDIGSATLNISFDNSLLSYVTYSAQQPTIGWVVNANNANGVITMQRSGATTFDDGNVVTLSFVYDIDTIGGEALIEFVGGTVLTDSDLVTIPVSLIGGAVTDEEFYTVSGQLTYMGDAGRVLGTSGSSATTVYLKNVADSSIAYTSTTDANGNYSFIDVVAGSYFLDAMTTIDATMAYDMTDAFVIYGIGGTLTGLQALAGDVNEVDGVDMTDAFIVYGSWQAGNVKVSSWTAPDWFFDNVVVTVSADVFQDFSGIASGDANADFVPVP